MPRPFRHVEGLLERAFELPVRRLFRVALQPVELTRAAARAMEGSAQIAAQGRQVANRYTIALNPQDFRAFASWRETMERELSDYLQQYALSRGWRCAGRPQVVLAEKADVPAARPFVTAEFVDAPALPTPATVLGRMPDATNVLRTSSPSMPPATVPALAYLEVPNLPLWPMQQPAVRLGRAPDNDLVVAEAGVSRYHARIDRVADGFVLRDLGSSNGTWLHGAPVAEASLAHGDSFALGQVPIRFWAPRR